MVAEKEKGAEKETEAEKETKARFGKVLGSAVNPVLREGNSDRRAAKPVKELAQRTVKRSPAMRPYSKENRSCVAHMKEGDFYGSEQSHVMQVMMVMMMTEEKLH